MIVAQQAQRVAAVNGVFKAARFLKMHGYPLATARIVLALKKKA